MGSGLLRGNHWGDNVKLKGYSSWPKGVSYPGDASGCLGVMLIMNGLMDWKSLVQHLHLFEIAKQRRSETINAYVTALLQLLRIHGLMEQASRICSGGFEHIDSFYSARPETQKWARCEALEAAIGYPGFGTHWKRYQGLRPLHCGLTVSAMALAAACCRCFDRSHLEEVMRFSRQIQGTVLSCKGKNNDGNCGWRFYSLSRAKPQFVDSGCPMDSHTAWTSVNMKRLDHHAHLQEATCTIHPGYPGSSGKLEQQTRLSGSLCFHL